MGHTGTYGFGKIWGKHGKIQETQENTGKTSEHLNNLGNTYKNTHWKIWEQHGKQHRKNMGNYGKTSHWKIWEIHGNPI